MDYQCSEKSIQEGKRLFRKAKESTGKQGDIIWARYKSCKASINQGIRPSKNKFVTNIIHSAFIDNDTNPFWKFVRAKRCDNTGVYPLKEGGQLFSDSQYKADILNRQFTSAFSLEDTTTIRTPTGDAFPSMPDVVVDSLGVQSP